MHLDILILFLLVCVRQNKTVVFGVRHGVGINVWVLNFMLLNYFLNGVQFYNNL